MTLFIQSDATGAGSGNVNAPEAFVNLAVIANGDTGLGFIDLSPRMQQITYARTLGGAPPVRLDTLVNTFFGVNPQNVDIIIVPVLDNFVLADGSRMDRRGITLPPNGSDMPGAELNNTTSCLVVYDTTDRNGHGGCFARAGTGGTLDLPITNPVALYHELSHASRVVTDALLEVTLECDPASPEENAAITEENDLRTQIANALGVAPELRDPNIHCAKRGCGGGACCIVATVASGSHLSAEVDALRAVRDGYLRRSEVGFAFFGRLHEAYYAFSPEIVRLIARHTELQDVILRHYVRPLVIALQTTESYTLGGLRGAQLAQHLRGRCTALGEAADEITEAELARALALLDPDVAAVAELSRGERELSATLVARARPNLYVRWALIDPLFLYLRARSASDSGLSDEEVGRSLAAAIDEWAARMPIDDFWQSLTRPEARNELRFLKDSLLVTPSARRRFGARLAGAFPESRAVHDALAAELDVDEQHA
jgi:hypothetical protein